MEELYEGSRARLTLATQNLETEKTKTKEAIDKTKEANNQLEYTRILRGAGCKIHTLR